MSHQDLVNEISRRAGRKTVEAILEAAKYAREATGGDDEKTTKAMNDAALPVPGRESAPWTKRRVRAFIETEGRSTESTAEGEGTPHEGEIVPAITGQSDRKALPEGVDKQPGQGDSPKPGDEGK